MTSSELDDEPRLSAWERRLEWPLIAVALVFLGVYAWQVIHVSAPGWLVTALERVMWLIWALFAADYVFRLVIARNKGRFFISHLFDLIVVALPMARGLRVLRVLAVFRLLNRRDSRAMRGQIWVYVVTVMIFVGLIAALAILDAERFAPDSSITSFPDALWWAVTTMSTVGYGDTYPVTAEGRFIAAGMMIGGVALLGVVTGTIASWFVERLNGAEDSVDQELLTEVKQLRTELAEVRSTSADR